MTARSPELQALVDCAEKAIFDAGPQGPALSAATEMFQLLRTPQPNVDVRIEHELPVRKHLNRAYALARSAPPSTAAVGAALETLEGLTPWSRRRDASASDPHFFDGHANATLVGPGGLEPRTDVLLGVSLMAPHMQYPDHHHAPEEIYLAMGSGGWRRDTEAWVFPAPGQLFYNTPSVVHAMITHEEPLLALWCLLPKDGVLR